MVWLVNVGLEGRFDASSVTVCPNRRLRTKRAPPTPPANRPVPGGSGADGPKPAHPSTPDTAPPMVAEVMESVGAAEMAWLATTSVCGTEKVFAVTAVTACGAAG